MDHRANAGLPFRAAITTLLILFLLGGFGQAAKADESSLLLNGRAIHLDQQPGVTYNENNWGFGLQYDLDPVGSNWVPFLMGSGFKDSNGNMSYYGGGGMLRRYHFVLGDTPLHFDAGVVAFFMTREGFKDGDAFPGILPAISLGTKRVSLNMTYIPKVDPKMVPVLFFQLKVNIGSF
jgi:hypothetical protein